MSFHGRAGQVPLATSGEKTPPPISATIKMGTAIIATGVAVYLFFAISGEEKTKWWGAFTLPSGVNSTALSPIASKRFEMELADGRCGSFRIKLLEFPGFDQQIALQFYGLGALLGPRA